MFVMITKKYYHLLVSHCLEVEV